MPILGLVVDFHGAQRADREQALAWIAASDALTPGEWQGNRLPLVVEADSKKDVDEQLTALRGAAAICLVEVVYVDFEDLVHGQEDPPHPTRDSNPGSEEPTWT